MAALPVFLTFCEGNHQWRVDSLHKGPVWRGFNVSFVVSLNNLLNKQSNCYGAMTLIWRRCNGIAIVKWLTCDSTVITSTDNFVTGRRKITAYVPLSRPSVRASDLPALKVNKNQPRRHHAHCRLFQVTWYIHSKGLPWQLHRFDDVIVFCGPCLERGIFARGQHHCRSDCYRSDALCMYRLVVFLWKQEKYQVHPLLHHIGK